MKQGYDIVLIAKNNLGEDAYKALGENLKKWVSQNEGEVTTFAQQGLRELAATFKNHTLGYFIHAQIKGTAKTVAELQRNFGVTESLIRFMIVRMESIVPSAAKLAAAKPRRAPRKEVGAAEG